MIGLGRRLRRAVLGAAAGRSGRCCPACSASRPAVRGLLLAVLLVVIVQQPVAGVVFVLDGVLIGAGDQDYLAVAGLVTLAVVRVAAATWSSGRRPGWSRCGSRTASGWWPGSPP